MRDQPFHGRDHRSPLLLDSKHLHHSLGRATRQQPAHPDQQLVSYPFRYQSISSLDLERTNLLPPFSLYLFSQAGQSVWNLATATVGTPNDPSFTLLPANLPYGYDVAGLPPASSGYSSDYLFGLAQISNIGKSPLLSTLNETQHCHHIKGLNIDVVSLDDSDAVTTIFFEPTDSAMITSSILTSIDNQIIFSYSNVSGTYIVTLQQEG